MSLEIKLFQPDMWKEFKELIRISYSSSYWMLDRKYFDWWYCNPPANWNSSHRLVVGILNDKIIGFVGQVANSFWVKEKELKGTWYANGMIHPDYRGQGLGTVIYNAAQKFTEFAAVVSFNEPAGNIFQKIGFNIFDWQRMKRAIYLADYSAIKQMPCSDSNFLGEIIRCFSDININKFIIYPLKQLPPRNEVDELWDLCKNRYLLTTKRNYEFLLWRYQNHPCGEYLFFSNYNKFNGKNILNALVTARLEMSNNLKILRIVDVFGEEKRVKKTLAGIIGWSKKEKICLIDFFCTNWPDYDAFIENNFMILEPEKANFLPYLFNPLEMKNNYYENIGVWAKNTELINNINYNDIYFVRGDGDRDRP